VKEAARRFWCIFQV